MTDSNDLRPQLAAAYGNAVTLVTAVTADQLDGATPCPAMDVSTMLDHLVMAARRAAGLGRGETPAEATETEHLELDEVPGALRQAGAEATAAWGDDAALARTITMPWGEEYPGSRLVGIYLIELATHGWDVAYATGNTTLLDGDLGTAALACAKASIRPDYRNDEGEPFGPEVAAPADATTWEQLAAFMGRKPR